AYAYDGAGNQRTLTDPRGDTTTNTWDKRRRLTQADGPSPSAGADPLMRVKYVYDANGNLSQQDVWNKDKDNKEDTVNPWITTTYAYTAENQLSSITEEI